MATELLTVGVSLLLFGLCVLFVRIAIGSEPCPLIFH